MGRAFAGLVFLAVTGGIVVVMFLAVAGRFTANQAGGQGGFGFPPSPVAPATVEEREFAELVETIGTARALESVSVTATVTETVSAISFDSGAFVEQDAILAELTSGEESASLRDARARVVEAERQYARIRDLVERGAASASRLDETLSERDRARAQVQAIEAQLADRLIRAPFSGVVGLRMVSPGSLVRPGDVLATLDDISSIKLDFSISERFLAQMKPGVPLMAQAQAYPDQIFEGTIESVDTRIDPSTRSVTVRAILPNEDYLLRSGMLLGVAVIVEQRLSASVPDIAVMTGAQGQYVYAITENAEGQPVAEIRPVTVGKREHNFAEILSGLAVGERIVAEGVHKIGPGMPLLLSEPEENGAPQAAAE